MIFSKSFQVLMLAFLIVMSVACSNGTSCESAEVIRTTSPDQIVDAVIEKTNCGATTSYSYRVFLTKHEDELPENHVFLSDKTENLHIEWEQNKRLKINYDKARIFEFKNFWQSKNIDDFGYIVEIEEERR